MNCLGRNTRHLYYAKKTIATLERELGFMPPDDEQFNQRDPPMVSGCIIHGMACTTPGTCLSTTTPNPPMVDGGIIHGENCTTARVCLATTTLQLQKAETIIFYLQRKLLQIRPDLVIQRPGQHHPLANCTIGVVTSYLSVGGTAMHVTPEGGLVPSFGPR